MPQERDQQILIAVLTVIVSFGIIYFGFKPFLADYQSAKVAVEARGREIKALQDRKESLKIYERFFSEQGTRVDRLRLIAPSEPNYPELVVSLSSLADQSGLLLTNVQPMRADSSGRSIISTITIRGEYPNILKFVERLETNIRPAKILSLNLARAGQEQTNNSLAATFKIKFAG